METLNQNWQTVSEIELIYKTRVKNSERPQIKPSKDAYKLVLSTWDYNKIEFFEQFKALLLNHAHKHLVFKKFLLEELWELL
jgi:DNA repair protein RadC